MIIINTFTKQEGGVAGLDWGLVAYRGPVILNNGEKMNREGDEPGTPGEGANPFDDNPSFDGGLPSPPPVRVSTPADRRFSLNMLMASAPSVNALLEP